MIDKAARRAQYGAVPRILDMPRINFLIVTCPRSGSTWVTTALNSHPAIRVWGGVFIERGRGQLATSSDDRLPPQGRYYEWGDAGGRGGVRHYLDGILDDPHAAASGFKVMYGQLRGTPAIGAYLLRRRMRVVHLVRTNLLDAIVSEDTAHARGWWHTDARDADAPNQPVPIDPTTLVARLEHRRRSIRLARRALRLLPVPSLELRYEELRADPQTAFMQTARFLGVSADGVFESQLRKINRAGSLSMIRNLDEVRTALRNTRYELLV